MSPRIVRRLRPLFAITLLALSFAPARADEKPLFDDFPGRSRVAARSGAVPARRAAVRPASVATVRSATSLAPSRPAAPRIGALGNSYVPPDPQTYLLLSNGFQELNGNCNDRGWVGKDRTADLFARVSDAYTVNQPLYSGVHATSDFTGNTSPLSTTALRFDRGVALTDSGTIIFSDIISTPSVGRTLYEIYPTDGFIRVYGTASDPTFSLGA